MEEKWYRKLLKKKLLVQAKLRAHIEVWIHFYDVDLILLAYSNLVKEYVVDIHKMPCFIYFFSHEYYSNVLWVLTIGMNINICKNQNKN